jgi:hypothetical protein
MSKKFTDEEVVEAALCCKKNNCQTCPFIVLGAGFKNCVIKFSEYIANNTKNEPTADVQEVKHGKWIFHERTKLVPTNKLGIKEEYTNGHSCAIVDDKNVNQKIMIMMKRITLKIPICSVCGWCGYDEYNATNYCPNCGAKCDI